MYEPYKGNGYTQIAEVYLLLHDGEEQFRTLYVYDVTDEIGDWLYEEQDKGPYFVREAIMDALNICDDYNVMPGALFHRYIAQFEYPHTVLLYDTVAYNV